jgi:hypothetical protein
MLIVIIQIAGWAADGDWSPIREAQRQFVVADGNALLVPALGRRAQADFCHLTKEGYFELAEEISRALLKNHYHKKDINWPGPVLDSALLAGADKSVACAHFAEVKKLAGCNRDDFTAIDADGAIKCTKAEAQNTRVILTFERAIKLPARLAYAYGMHPQATLVDEAGNRAPAVQLDLATGTIPADSETSAPNGAGVKK